MKIESIKEALKQKAQSLNVTPMTVAAPAKEQPAPMPTARPRQNTQQAAESSSVVVPLNTPQTPAPVTEPKAVSRKAGTTRTRAKAKSVPLSDIEAIVAEHLKAGIDYNTIPGCGRKPALLKSGAEVLCSVFGFYTQSEVINRVMELEKGFVLYEVSTTVFDAEGNIKAIGIGSCNSHEKKYLKQGFAASLNTILKMARKRSYVDAILSATGSSRIFTQDIDLAAMGAEYQESTSRKEA